MSISNELMHMMRHYDAEAAARLMAVDGWWALSPRERRHEMREAHAFARSAQRHGRVVVRSM